MPRASSAVTWRRSRAPKAWTRTSGSRWATMSSGSPTTGSRPAKRARSIADGMSRHDADRQVAEAAVLDQGGEEGFDRRRAEAFADDDAVDVAIVEIARGGLDAERPDDADPLADRDGQRRVAAPASRHQHGGVVERIGVGQQRHVGAVVAQGVDAAQHRRVQGAHAQRRSEPGDDLLVGGAGADRQHVEDGGAAIVDPRHHRHERRRHGVDGVHQLVGLALDRRGIRIGEQHGRRLDFGDRLRGLGERALDHRKSAGPRERGDELAIGAIGDDEDRARQRHFTQLRLNTALT